MMKTKSLLSFLFLLCCSVNLFSQNWVGANSSTGSGSAHSLSVATDISGNVYVTGYFTSTITFGSFTLNHTSAMDIFIVKYDKWGFVVWAKNIGGISDDFGYKITTDMSGNVYVTGDINHSVVFGNTTLVSAGNDDIFIVKYDGNGNVLWAKSAGGIADDFSGGVAVDAAGNVYITGYFDSPTITFGSITLTNPTTSPPNWGYTNMFIAKYNSAGNVLWVKAPASYYSQALDIEADKFGNVYVTGNVINIITFDSIVLNSGNSNNNIFLVKYNASGKALWAKCAGGNSGGGSGRSITTDALGNVYFTGYFLSKVSFGSDTLINAGSGASPDVFLVKDDSSGNTLWAKRAGGTQDDVGCSLALDFFGDIYMTGRFRSPSISFGSISLPFPAGGVDPLFIVKYNASGTAMCASALPSGGDTVAYYYNYVSNVLDGNGVAAYDCYAYVASGFKINPFQVGPDTLALTGTQNAFLAKYTCELAAYQSHTNIKCYGQCNGTATATAAGGTGHYTYSWSNGQTTSAITGLCSGPYIVTITDGGATSCPATVILGIMQPATPLNDSATVVSNYCSSHYAGNAFANVSGGTLPYSYYWSNGQTTPVNSNLLAGTYSVIITDNNGCADTSTVIIPAFPPPIPLIAGADTICNGGSDVLNASGGVSYTWNTGATSQSISVSPTSQVTYSVTVTGSDGCKADTFFTVKVNPIPTSNAGADTICTGNAYVLNAPGGVSYAWNTGVTSQSISVSPTSQSNYSVMVTDGSGCKAETFFTILVNPIPNANAGTNVTINYGDAITLVGSGGGNYWWSTGSSADSILVNPIATTSYSLIVTNANGCTDVAVVTVFVKPLECAMYIPNAFSPNDDGRDDIYYVFGKCIAEMTFTIYDRWGEKVFETNDPKTGWDGRYKGQVENAGVFMYSFNGTLTTGEKVNQKGNITLMR